MLSSSKNPYRNIAYKHDVIVLHIFESRTSQTHGMEMAIKDSYVEIRHHVSTIKQRWTSNMAESDEMNEFGSAN